MDRLRSSVESKVKPLPMSDMIFASSTLPCGATILVNAGWCRAIRLGRLRPASHKQTANTAAGYCKQCGEGSDKVEEVAHICTWCRMGLGSCLNPVTPIRTLGQIITTSLVLWMCTDAANTWLSFRRSHQT